MWVPVSLSIFLTKYASTRGTYIIYYYFLLPKPVPVGTPRFLASGSHKIASRLSYIKDHLHFHGPQIDGWPQDNRTISSQHNPSVLRMGGPPHQVPGHNTLPLPRGILILEHRDQGTKPVTSEKGRKGICRTEKG